MYTSGDEAELFLNGKSLGRKRKEQYTYRLRWEDTVYEPGELKAVAYKNGKRWAETYVRTTGEPVALKLRPDKMNLKADGDDLVFVRVSLVDAKGNEVPTAENRISCSVNGKGCVVATDNGDPTSMQIFSETERPAFNGLLLAIVKADKGANGKLVFKAESEGLKGATVVLNVKN